MRPKEYLVLFTLAALWGASFLFIKVAIDDLSPLTLVFIRMVIGAAGLLLFVLCQSSVMKGWHKHIKAFTVVTIFNAIIPYLAISWGEQYITSGMAAILNATTPLVLVIISMWWPGGERLTWLRLIAVILGFLGVGMLVGPSVFSFHASDLTLIGALAVIIGAASYAFAGLLARKLLAGLPLMQQATGQIGMGALLLAPVAGVGLVIQPLTHVPSVWVIASVLALSLGGTTIAYLCYFWLLEHVGATRTLIVTYLLPCMALIYGAILLHEPISINGLGGLALVLVGIFLAGQKSDTKLPLWKPLSRQE